jgi:DNA-binding MarR family transcriptional regulator
MSISQLGAVLNVPADITPTERLVLVLLARDAGPDGVAFPALGRLAAAANVHPSTVSRALRRLVENGLVQRAASRTTTGAAAPAAYRVIVDVQAADGPKEGPA